ncbi:hypothetical protein GQ457_03G012310 [Hibiscus cannabinus]
MGLDDWFCRLRKEIKVTEKSLKERLKQLNDLAPKNEVLGEITEAKIALNLEADKEELYWEQRARANWMKSGDRNTSFFHKFASYRRKRNRVDRLVDDSGKVVNSNENLLRVATDYFKKLYQSNGPSNHDQILEGITSCIDEDMNGKLDEVFTNEEVLVALKSMSPLKASGEDGLGVVFYQRFWHIVGQEVSRFCFDMLNGNYEMKDINHTRIVLIPKVDNPQHMFQFRPISLCNVLYKIISKMLANRFSRVLHLCIDEAQSAFVPGRLISDNVLVAYEILHLWDRFEVAWPTEVDQASFFEWMVCLFESFNKSRREEIAFTLWAIWFCRNLLIHEGKIQDLESLVTFVRSYKFEFGNFFLNLNRPIPSTSVGWKPPPNEWVKINVDACCPLSKDKAFSGAIIRNYKGSVLGSCIKFQHDFSSVFMAEAKAVVHGLSFAAELGFHHVILESDSRSLIQKLNSSADDSSAIRPVVSDIKNLARRFVECIFHFTTRDNNQAAHAVAAMGKNLISDTSWIEDVPPEVLSLVEADQRNISAS